ncbi:hypothetical protein [Mucilaginibacter psychrotolerans]|uniref:Uncharacterized protein n=1 Tax=Mucilaginibacter psychrotolerans TaxID=1524096 RepID=A0A4Y8SEP7_9SPHI|nr:hypothetical protein [Mucilaginibacter psychrotolerans]TFF36924.1 hypothetical protein E2R66_14280 [Mucilaginibacter psychrotolerans]
MTITAIREKLHDYIDSADVKRVQALYSKMEDDISEKKLSTEKKIALLEQAANDPLFLADQKEIMDDFHLIDDENI